MDIAKSWRAYEAMNALINGWWGYKLVQLHWKTADVQKLKISTLTYPAIPG